MKLAVGLMFSILFSNCFACEVPPSEQRTPPDELIARTKNIALAKVVKAEISGGNEVLYTFETIKQLAGKTKEHFQILGYPAIWEGDNRGFNNHFDKDFWSEPGGRVSNDTDCQIHPTFSVGGTYLLFLDQPYHAKSFEIIIRTHGDATIRDKWLQYVERRTGP